MRLEYLADIELVYREEPTATFEAEDERYQWLNNTFCVVEGVIANLSMQARVYDCINELL